ncbi:hypothetical protein [Bergeyella sp. RCAD1439]|uniref:hypothetical protein n=1 Tax=Bergeyella anatis TaxID=3113737 RepID=UPI002E17E071|nr:hypothetical protein [Bergeyella sp. RCAD1439]
MRIKFYFLIFALGWCWLGAQDFSGEVRTDGVGLPSVLVVNINTSQKVYSNLQGAFVLQASQGDEIRLMKQGYERVELRVGKERSVLVNMQSVPKAIEEVSIGFRPSGDLKKDAEALNRPNREIALNKEVYSWRASAAPKAVALLPAMPSTLNLGPNYKAGQINLLSVGGDGGLIGTAVGALKKKLNPKKEPDFTQRQAFYRRVKASLNLEEYYKYGIDDYQLDQILVYADQRFDLTKNYASDFKEESIASYLTIALREFLKIK